MMTDPRVPLKNPVLAAVLGYLIPGLGHAYQGRFFKATVYAVCILGTFFAGMALGDWQPVYYRMDSDHSRFSYFSQVMVGLPALPAIVQDNRFQRSMAMGVLPGLDNSSSLESSFVGELRAGRLVVPISGSISLRQSDDVVTGEFRGTNDEMGVVRYQLSGVNLHPKVYPSRDRECECQVVDSDGKRVGSIQGVIPRGFTDWCQVPLGGPRGDGTYDNTSLAAVHGRLGKRFDLASVFTWIAGLLNVLAIWDAFEGPAYGYGDEQEGSNERAGSEGDDE